MTQRAVAALSQKEQNWQAPDKEFEDEICGILKRDIRKKAYPIGRLLSIKELFGLGNKAGVSTSYWGLPGSLPSRRPRRRDIMR